MRINIVEYDREWVGMFEAQKLEIIELIGEWVEEVEHIGSTAVEGLCAKAIIDVMVGVKDFGRVGEVVEVLVGGGYEYYEQYNEVMGERRFFKKTVDGRVVGHVHVVQRGGEFWERHLLFRDYLRAEPGAVREYGELKKELAMKDWEDSNDYCNAKTEFIRGIEKLAMRRFKI